MLILLHWNFNNWPLFFTQGEAEEQKSDTVEVGDNCHHSVTSLEHADSDSLQSVTSLEHVDSDSLPMTSPSKIPSRIYYSLIVFFNMSDLLVLLSPLELKLKLSLSDCLLSNRLSVHLSVSKLFTFSSSPPEPLGQFQPKLAQCILGWL